MTVQINQPATQTHSRMVEAKNAITRAQTQERKGDLDEAQNMLEQVYAEYERGNYSEALSLANQAIIKADGSTFSESGSFPLLEVVGIIVILVAVGLVICFLKLRNRTELVKPKPKKRNIDIERIFVGYKNLLPEEKQAIQFLVDNNGEAFEAELFDYVKLPRIITGRMVKRLKKMNIITVTKFRRQNLVRIKSKYDIK